MVFKIFVQCTVWIGVMAVVLFLGAGRWDWPQGWAFVAIFAVGSTFFVAWLLKRDPALLASRMDVSARQNAPMFCVNDCKVLPRTSHDRLRIAATQSSLPRPIVNVNPCPSSPVSVRKMQ